MTATRRLHITRQMTSFFSFNLWALSVGIFYFCISRTPKFGSMGSTFAVCSGLQNTHWYAKDDTFIPVNVGDLFLHKLC